MKKVNQKGFTLAELLIVVAIIAILVAIAIPTFSNQLEKSRQAVDIATLREAYAAAKIQEMDRGSGIKFGSDINKHFEEMPSTSTDSSAKLYVFKPAASTYTHNTSFTAATDGLICACWYMPGEGTLTAIEASASAVDLAETPTDTKKGNATSSKLVADTSKIDKNVIIYTEAVTLADETLVATNAKTGPGTIKKGVLVVFEKANDDTWKLGQVTYAGKTIKKDG